MYFSPKGHRNFASSCYPFVDVCISCFQPTSINLLFIHSMQFTSLTVYDSYSHFLDCIFRYENFVLLISGVLTSSKRGVENKRTHEYVIYLELVFVNSTIFNMRYSLSHCRSIVLTKLN